MMRREIELLEVPSQTVCEMLRTRNRVATNGMCLMGDRKSVLAAAQVFQLAAKVGALEVNLRHWREECGKLHAQLAKAKADLQSWETTAKRIEEAEAAQSFDDGSCIRCASVPRNASGLCATCLDEDAVRAGEISDMAGVAEQSGAGAPETSVRCGAPAATLPRS